MKHKVTFRPDLLLLIGVVILVNTPFLTDRCMPIHDTKGMLGLFDYFYSNYLYYGELPRWMAYGLYGQDATVIYLSLMTGANCLTFFMGKLLGIKDSLFLFAFGHLLEHLLLLFGIYLLCSRLYVERRTVFCISLVVVSTVVWNSQQYFNFSFYYLLPLEFYCLLRLKHERVGYWGWLAGIVAILGPMGAGAYCYPLWAFILSVFSLVLFWGDAEPLYSTIQINLKNIGGATVCFMFAFFLLGLLWKAQDNLISFAPLRSGDSAGVPLWVFLTYGGHDLSELWSELVLPSANLDLESAQHMGMNDYIGLIGLGCLPLALGKLNCRIVCAFAVSAAALFALSRGGILAIIIYCFPGMSLFRHVGYITAILKLLILVLAGFGLDALIYNLKNSSFVNLLNRKTFYMAILAACIYIDLYLGDSISRVVSVGYITGTMKLAILFPLLRGACIAVIILAVWRLGQASLGRDQTRKLKTVLLLLTFCVVADCALFQVELLSHLKYFDPPISFPTIKPVFNSTRSDRIADSQQSKYKAWFSGLNSNPNEAEYEICYSSVMHLDPTSPRYRVEWYPKNVWEMQKAIDKASNDYKVLCGIEQPRCRVLSQVQYVKTDQDAATLLKTQTGYDKKLILEGPSNGELQNAIIPKASVISTTSIIPEQFSANFISMDIIYTSSQPAWLVYADAYSPYWYANVNGKPVSVLKAYGAFKALAINKGMNHIKLYYYKGVASICLVAFMIGSGVATLIALLYLFGIAFTGEHGDDRSESICEINQLLSRSA